MSEFPKLSEIEARLQSLGLLTGTLPATMQWIEAAVVRMWEQETGYQPWLATRETRTFPIEQGLVYPKSGMIIIHSVAIDSQSLTLNNDYVAHPINASPHQWLNMRRRTGDVEIDATWGYSATNPVPEDVWGAVLANACLLAIPNLQPAPTGGLTRIKQGDVEYSYINNEQESKIAMLKTFYTQILMRYRRLRGLF